MDDTNAALAVTDPDHVEDLIADIDKRLETDAAFRQQYQADPVGTLIAQGLSPDVAAQLADYIARSQNKTEAEGPQFALGTPGNW